MSDLLLPAAAALDAVRLPSHGEPRSSKGVPPTSELEGKGSAAGFALFLSLGAGGLALGISGFGVPDLDFSLTDSAVFIGLYAIGAAIVGAIGGRQRLRLLSVYSTYTMLASAAFVAATIYGSSYGSSSPVFLIDRFRPRDDHNLFVTAIHPSIGSRLVSLFEGQTNAPLHWYVNVRVHELIIDLTGRPQMMVGNGLNIVVGSITAALLVGAIGLSIRPSRRGRFPAGIPIAFVLGCPWLLASSIIAIREVWVYALFAAAFYGGLMFARLGLVVRLVALGALAAGCGTACYLLRGEMMPLIVVLVLLAGTTVQDRPLVGAAQTTLVVGIVAVAAVAIAPLVTLRKDSVSATMEARSMEYHELAGSREAGEKGTVDAIIGTGFAARRIVNAVWMPFKPLPKVAFFPGSTYQLGKLLTPGWLLACIGVVWTLARRAEGDEPPEGTSVQRYRWLILWMAAMTVLIGLTSAEVRHFYAQLPVACALMSDIFQTRTTGPQEVAIVWRKGVLFGVTILVLSGLFTLVAFGLDSLIPAA
jgi:hypothetical protein